MREPQPIPATSSTSGRARLLDWLPVALALPLYLAGIGWGWGAEHFWSWDEPRPAAVLAAPYAEEPSWPVRYPLLQRDLLRGLFALAMPVVQAAGVEEPPAVERCLFFAGRALSVLMALATLRLAFATAVAVGAGSRRAGLAAAAIWLATLPQAYYAKTMNLEAPYLFWSALAIWAFVLARRTPGESRWSALFGCAAAAAMLTKDQSFGLFVLPAIWLAFEMLRWRPRALGVLLVVAGGAVLFAAASYRLGGGADLLRRHAAAVLAHPATYASRAPDLAGPGDQLLLGLRHVVWSFGLPLTLLVAGGVAVVLATARRNGDPLRPAASLLLFPLSYVLFALFPLGYQYDRFLLPVCWTLAVVGAVGGDHAGQALGTQRVRVLVAAALACAVGWGLWRVVTLDRALAGDRRYALEQATASRSRVAVFVRDVRPPQGFARLRVEGRESPTAEDLAAYSVVAIPALDLGDPRLSALARTLHQGTCGFRALLPELAEPSPLRRELDFGGVLTNLDEVDPPMLAFEREDPGTPCLPSGKSYPSRRSGLTQTNGRTIFRP